MLRVTTITGEEVYTKRIIDDHALLLQTPFEILDFIKERVEENWTTANAHPANQIYYFVDGESEVTEGDNHLSENSVDMIDDYENCTLEEYEHSMAEFAQKVKQSLLDAVALDLSHDSEESLSIVALGVLSNAKCSKADLDRLKSDHASHLLSSEFPTRLEGPQKTDILDSHEASSSNSTGTVSLLTLTEIIDSYVFCDAAVFEFFYGISEITGQRRISRKQYRFIRNNEMLTKSECPYELYDFGADIVTSQDHADNVTLRSENVPNSFCDTSRVLLTACKNLSTLTNANSSTKKMISKIEHLVRSVADHATERLLDSENFILEMSKVHPIGLAYASNRLLGESDFLIDLIRKEIRVAEVIENVDRNLLNGREFILQACQELVGNKIAIHSILENAGTDVKDDRGLMLEICCRLAEPSAIRFASQRIKDDVESSLDLFCRSLSHRSKCYQVCWSTDSG